MVAFKSPWLKVMPTTRKENRLRNSETHLLYKSNENIRRNGKDDFFFFFRILEINQSLAVTQGAFIQEKWLNLSMKSKNYGSFICLIPVISSSALQ